MHEAMKQLGENQTVSLGTIDLGKVGPEGEVARQNAAQVIYATIDLEKLLNTILQTYYFGLLEIPPTPERVSQRELQDSFRYDILEAPALQFSFKRTLVMTLVNRNKLLRGQAKCALENDLSKFEKWRNAFAHGEISFEGDKGHTVTYYKGGPRVAILDDEFWEDVESRYEAIVTNLSTVETALKSRPDGRGPTTATAP